MVPRNSVSAARRCDGKMKEKKLVEYGAKSSPPGTAVDQCPDFLFMHLVPDIEGTGTAVLRHQAVRPVLFYTTIITGGHS